MKKVLVLDVGTTNVRASIVDEEGAISTVTSARCSPSRHAPGIAEFDPSEVSSVALAVARTAIESTGRVEGVGVATQRASTVLWDRATSTPLGPGIGWQDLRTAGQCLALRQQGLRLAPNQSATKLSFLLSQCEPQAIAGAAFGTIDTWVAWNLSHGSVHATDASNAGLTGLIRTDASGWDEEVLAKLGIEGSLLPRIVPSTGVLGSADVLPGAPPIAALVGDQQASLLGQGCVLPGSAKATFGTGGMLDCLLGSKRPAFEFRGEAGTFPIIGWREDDVDTWGIEAVSLAAGSCVDWLRDGLGLLDSVEDSDAIAASVRDSGGVTFVPAFGGLGAPVWDFGARGVLVGLDHATGRAEVVHAVLDGIAQTGADLLQAAEVDSHLPIEELHVDGGMSANTTFVQLLADAIARPVLVSEVREATTLGAAFLAGRATGVYPTLEAAAALARHRPAVDPRRAADRGRWFEAREKARGAVPFLSRLEF